MRKLRPLFTLALLTLTLIASGCVHGLDRGTQALLAGDADQAETIARAELSADASSPWANLLLAEVLAADGEYREALPYARRADRSDAYPARVPRLLGQIYTALNQPVDAAENYRRARQSDSNAVDDETYIQTLLFAIPFTAVRRDQENQWRLRVWLSEVSPEHPEAAPERIAVARRAYAVALRDANEIRAAVDLLRQALDDDPAHLTREALDLGELYARLNMPEDATLAWQFYLDADVSKEERLQRHFDVAEAAARHDFYDLASSTLSAVLPELTPAEKEKRLLNLAQYQLRADRDDEARQTLARYIELGVGDRPEGQHPSDLYHRAAVLAINENRPRIAIQLLERGTSLAVADHLLTRTLADIYAHRAQFDAIEVIFNRLVDRSDDPAQALYIAAEWARARRNHELSRHFLSRATEFDDTPASLWLELAEIHGMLEDFDELSQATLTYLNEEGHSDTALSRAAQLLVTFRAFEEAEPLLKELQSRQPENRSVTSSLANLYRQWGRPDESAEVWEQWINIRGSRPVDIEQVAELLFHAGENERAAALFLRAGQAGQNHAWLRAADIYLQQDHHAAMTRALDAYIEHHSDRPRALEEVASRYHRAGMTRRRIEVLSELAELRPDNWRVHDTLSGLLLAQGQQQEALDLLTRFVENASDPYDALASISGHFSSRHPAALLIDFYAQWTKGDETHPTVWRLFGDAYYSLAFEDGLAAGSSDQALRRARGYYLRFLDAVTGEQQDGHVHPRVADQDWRSLAMDWKQREMWRPAARAFEKLLESGARPQTFALSYAEVLLRLGEPSRAEALLADLYTAEGRRAETGVRIARLLQNFQRFDQAKEYAQRLFVSGNDDSASEGFLILVEIHRQSGDFDTIDKLIAEFPERTGNRSRARRLIISVLEENGRWRQAAQELERFKTSIVDQAAFYQGRHLVRADELEAAFDSFDEAALSSTDPSSSWLNAANYLRSHGAVDAARRAFDFAINAAPDRNDVRMHRGLFLIEQGDFSAALQDLDHILLSQSGGFDIVRQNFFEAFRAAGRFDLARRAAQNLDSDALVATGALQAQIGSLDLRSQQPQFVDAAIDRLHAGTWGLSGVIPYLNEAGHHEESLRLIFEEFEEGDASTASLLLLSHAPTLARVSRWNTHKNYLSAIIDPLQRSDTRLIGVVGDHRSRMGALPEARLYLQAAVDYGDGEYLAQLGHTHLLLGQRQQAMAYFEAWLLDQRATPQALESVLLRFELAGDADGAAKFLARIVDEPSLLHIALPQKTHYDLERQGDPSRAVDALLSQIEAARRLPASAFRPTGSRASSASLSYEEILSLALIRSLESIAALGHLDAVDAVFTDNEIPQDILDQLLPLQLKITIAQGDIEGADQIADRLLAATDGVRERQHLRLDLARRFLSFGADTSARRLVDDALREQTDFQNHQPFAIHLGLLLIADKNADLLAEIQQYLERVPNPVDARHTLIDDLRRLGRDSEALALATEAVEILPTGDNQRRALIAALNDGNSQRAQHFMRRYLQTADDSLNGLISIVERRLAGSEPRLILPLVTEIRRALPSNLRWQIEEIRLLFIAGEVEKARRIMLQAVEDRAFHRDAVTLIVEMLAKEHLDVELARVLAPALPEDALWPRLTIRIAEAEFSLGFADEAQRWLTRLEANALNPRIWRLELGDRLANRHHFAEIAEVLAPYAAEDLSPHGQFLLGLASLATGDSPDGIASLRQANAAGVGMLRSHFHGIQAALHAGDPEAAAELMQDLTMLPIRSTTAVSFPLQIALASAMDQPGGPQAIRTFLEAERPRLVDGHGSTWTEFAGQLAGAFERTDDPEGAYGFYRDRIWQSLFNRDNDRSLPVYLNNLAYTYSTTNHRVDDGVDAVFRAMVLSQDRNSSYIDTLGWLFYRQGDPVAAEAEIRRALRTYEGPPSGLRELYSHLKELLQTRGLFAQAAWIDVHLRRLPVNDLEW